MRWLIVLGLVLIAAGVLFTRWNFDDGPAPVRVVRFDESSPDAGRDVGVADAGRDPLPSFDVDDRREVLRARAQRLINAAATDAGRPCRRPFEFVDAVHLHGPWVLSVSDISAEPDAVVNAIDGVNECAVRWSLTPHYLQPDGGLLSSDAAAFEASRRPFRPGGSGSRSVSDFVSVTLDDSTPAVVVTEADDTAEPVTTVLVATRDQIAEVDLAAPITGLDAWKPKGGAPRFRTFAPYDPALFQHGFAVSLDVDGRMTWDEAAARAWCPKAPKRPRFADQLVCARLWGVSAKALKAQVRGPAELIELIELEPPLRLKK